MGLEALGGSAGLGLGLLQEGHARTVFGEMLRQQGQVHGNGGSCDMARAMLSLPEVSPNTLAVKGVREALDEEVNIGGKVRLALGFSPHAGSEGAEVGTEGGTMFCGRGEPKGALGAKDRAVSDGPEYPNLMGAGRETGAGVG